MDGQKVEANKFMPPGAQALVRDGQVVCICQIGDPIEDAVYDSIIMHPTDIARLDAKMDDDNRGKRL